MKRLFTFLLLFIIVKLSAQVTQFPQLYYNGQGAGGANLLIHQSTAYSSPTITLLAVTSKIGADALFTNSLEPNWMNWIQVCLPSTSSTNNNPNYGYMPCDEFYARINETNNYATVNTVSTPLGVRQCAGCSSNYVTIGSSNAYYGKNSILALTGNVSSGWYEIYLTNNCSQLTGWVNGIYLAFPSSQSYYNVCGRVCDNAGSCAFLGNINQALTTFSGYGTTYSSGGYFQYKVPAGWSGNITCSHPNYSTSTPSFYSGAINFHTYNKDFVLSSGCTPVSLSGAFDQFVTVGSDATFTVSPTGTAPFTYQWYENGTLISGATSSSYTKFNCQLSDDWHQFQCYGTNCSGSYTSSSTIATLHVSPAASPTISGYIKDVSVNKATKTIDLNNYAGCLVTAYYQGTPNVAGTDVSAGDGYFEIILPSNGIFDIIVVDNSVPTNSVKMSNISANSFVGDMKVPATLINQIQTAKSHLINLNPTISSIGSTLLTFDYNTANQTAIVNQWKNITSNYDDIVESAGRLYVADSILQRFYLNSDKLNNEVATDIYELIKSAWSLVTVFDKTEQFLSNTWFDFLVDLVHDVREILIGEFIQAIENSLALLPPEKYQLKVLILSQIELLKDNPYQGSNFTFAILQPIIENIAASYMINHEYIQPTQSNLNYADANASSLTFSGNFNSHFVQASLLNIQATAAADIAQIDAELHRDYSNIINRNVDFFNAASNAVATTSLVQIAGILRTIAFAGNLWSYGQLGLSLNKATNGFYSNIDRLQPAISSVYRNGSSIGFPSTMTVLTELDSAVQTYNSTLYQLKSAISNGNIDSVFNNYNGVVSSYKNLRLAIKNAFVPIISSEYNSYLTISGYDSVLFNNFIYTLNLQPAINCKLQFALMSFLCDSSNLMVQDSIVNYIDSLIPANLNLRPEFDALFSIVSGIPMYNYIQSIESNVPHAMENSTNKLCYLKFKNWGPTDCTDLYAKISFDSPFISNIDSIYIGNLLVNQIDSINFTISSPIPDTSVTYNILFFGTNTICEGFIGAIKSRDIPVSPSLNFNSFTCSGDTLKLFALSNSPQVRYHWIGPNGFTSSLQNPTIPNVSTLNFGLYSCYVTSEGLSSNPSSIQVTGTIPSPSINGALSFCAGANTTIFVNQTYMSYQWSNGDTTQSTLINLPGVYSVTVTDSSGCSGTGSVTVALIPPPNSFYNNTFINWLCYPDTTILYIPSQLNCTYLWQRDTTVVAAITDTLIVPYLTGNYALTVTDTVTGCSSTHSEWFFRFHPVDTTVFINGSSNLCYGDSVTLAVHVPEYNINFTLPTVAWYQAGSPPVFISNDSSITVSSSGYYFAYLDNHICPSNYTDSILITFSPQIIANTNTTNVGCFGDSTGSISVLASGGIPQLEYSLDNTTYQLNPVFSNLPFGTYTVYIRDSLGCITSQQCNITQPAVLTGSVVNQTLDDCFPGGSGTVSVTGINGTLPYQYSIDGGITFQTLAFFDSLLNGSNTVIVQDANGCTNSISFPIGQTQPQNNLLFTIANDSLISPYTQSMWYYVGNATPFASGDTVMCQQTDSIYVSGLDNNGCSATSAVIFVTCFVGLDSQYLQESNITIFPNPSNGTTTISYLLPYATKVSINLTDALGKHISTITDNKYQSGANAVTIKTSKLNAGIYFVDLKMDDKLFTKKLIVQH